MDEHKTVVVFRLYETGELLALFPGLPYSDVHHEQCMSYQHVGQHGGADYNHCIRQTCRALPHEYEPLKKELEAIGYNLNVRERYTRKV
jgi:hypothetical protein